MKRDLQAILLSPAVSTELQREAVSMDKVTCVTKADVYAVLSLYVPDVDKLKGRSGRMRVSFLTNVVSA